MYEKLTEEKQTELLEAGIRAFSEYGMEKASMAAIAKKAGISVGVMYKYYSDKETFFLACVRRSIDRLEETLSRVLFHEDSLVHYADRIIRALQAHAAEYENDIRMYYEITSGYCKKNIPSLTAEIEKKTAELYKEMIRKAQENGTVRQDLEPGLFAFFFDNLLMMLQFSLCCDYYKERWKFYWQDEKRPEDHVVRAELLKFLEFGFLVPKADSP